MALPFELEFEIHEALLVKSASNCTLLNKMLSVLQDQFHEVYTENDLVFNLA